MVDIPFVGDFVNIGGGIAGAVGVGVGIWKKRQLGNVVKEVFDVIQKYREAKSAKSKGGEAITPEEFDVLIEEIEQAVKAVAKVWR